MHIPVMLEEVIKHLNPRDGETYVDCTFGRGGYTKAILDAANVNVFGIDCDPDAALFAKNFRSHLKHPDNFHFIEGNFKDIVELLHSQNVSKVDAIILDLGVSSVQLDEAGRGFSFSKEARLDMRMSRDGYSAYEFVNEADEKTIADVIYKYGEEHNAFRIARNIVKARKDKAIETTTELADIVKSAFFTKNRKIDPATKTFQAIRIFVNNELDNLEAALESAESLLKEGGRLIVVSFHSLEDSIVKQFLKEKCRDKTETGSRYIPKTVDIDLIPTFAYVVKKSVQPSEREVKTNPRARSARLRVATRINTEEIYA